MEGKTARGASSPANPALHIPEPLSTTSAAISSSMAELRRATEGENPLKTLKSFESTSSYQRPLLAVTSSRFLFTSCGSSRGRPLGGARGPHCAQAQTKGNGAAFYHYHIRTWLVLEQLCGYRRHGARPERQGGTSRENRRPYSQATTPSYSPDNFPYSPRPIRFSPTGLNMQKD